uniref:LIM and calponin homology domains 1 n=1 Tax=Panthera leo TaxID=9689 RepID=A0A8C8WCL7_PANLE
MACPALGLEALQPLQPEPPPEPAFSEAQKWIEQVTGRSFGDKDFRTGLENGILLCELLNAIKPGLVKKINRLPTPIAGLDNIILFLRGCKELGLRESQLFDPSDLQDTSNRVTVKSLDYSRKLKNVLVTIYWLGKAANSSASYSGTTLNLKEFEGLLAQMRKETDDIESPKRSIRDSGYIDCWDSERSDSLSPPRHGRDDSFDSLDSFGSRSRQTPSPDVVLRGSSDGRGSDSESDLPHRKLPDVKKDDMSARRTSHGEPKSAVPFNQYLPNKSNQTAYVPAPLRKKKAEREEYRKSWSTATSPLGGDRPFRYGPRTPVSDDAESTSMFDMRCEEEAAVQPHSRARQEQLQLINNQLREEDDKWQDDLARWKSRRRSASQDLIKKEEERKKMEKLLAGEDGTSERRKSIKTYREIVQEKERRERELHEAYKNARSQEEAEGILQQYIERFTISEAVLERLEMPKILERSHSTEPNLTPFLNDPNPMKYLRQQSLPPPKFTATVETTIARTSVLDTSMSAGSGSPSKTVTPKAVPMLTPKPYSQPKNSQEVLKTFKETTEETEPNSQEDENDGKETQKGNTELASPEPQHFTTTVTRSSPTVPFVEFSSSPRLKNDVPEENDQKKLEDEMSGKVELVLSQKERYQKEQNKLKEEWEKAQKEVEEEERRYYEEERKIIEDTVVPFTVSSSSADQLSTSSSVTEGSGTVNKTDLENCREEEQQIRQKKPLQGDKNDLLLLKTKEGHSLEEKGSLTQGAMAHSKSPVSKGIHQDRQLDTETGALHCGMNPQLAQDPSQSQQVSNPPMHILEDVKPKTLPLDKSINHQIESPSERRKSISGKKLCSSCGLPLGKGAAMIIETLQLYFHIQCFRCGICKGQLGDAVSGTDVRIRNGLLNCNDCYMRSRSAGQPTTL